MIDSRRLSSRNTTGYRGVTKKGTKFQARIRIDGKQIYLGQCHTAKETALLFDRAVVLHKRPKSLLNYPDGLPIDDEDYDALMNPNKKRTLSSRNTTGYTGVYKIRERYRASICVGAKTEQLGTYDTSKEAAVAYDRAVIQHKFSSSKLNFPGGLSIDDEYYEELMHPKKKRRLDSRNTSGYTGVFKNGRRFQAQLSVSHQKQYLGSYATAKEAALAYDRAVVQHKLPSIKLNFPNDHTSSDGSSNDGSSDDGESDDGESDDGESDDDDTLAHPPSPQARPYFERDPMLDQLVAEELHKRQKINKCGSMDTWIPVQEGEMISSV
jgi:hypothetical protein